jgi:hypothetical protein
MFITKKALIAGMAVSLCIPLAGTAAADEGVRVAAVKDPVVIKECGACHMAYQPGFLPARSWEKLMSGLKDHFGENAELDDAKVKQITEYLTANASGQGRGTGIRGLSPSDAPLRISELPWFKREHGRRVTPEGLKRHGAKSVSDCVACHRGAAEGNFDDD